MTLDHLPQTIAELAEASAHDDDRDPSGKAGDPAIPAEESSAPEPESTAADDDSWQQTGFGSFP